MYMFFDRKTYQTTIKNGLKNVTDTPNVRGFSICFFSAVPYCDLNGYTKHRMKFAILFIGLNRVIKYPQLKTAKPYNCILLNF